MTNIWEKATAQVRMISVKRRGLQFPMLLLFIHLAACLCATLPCPVAHLVMRWRLAEHPIEYLGASTIWPFQHVGFKQNQLFAFDYINILLVIMHDFLLLVREALKKSYIVFFLWLGPNLVTSPRPQVQLWHQKSLSATKSMLFKAKTGFSRQGSLGRRLFPVFRNKKT